MTTKKENINLKHIDINEFKEEIYQYYLAIFPEKERKSLELLQSSYERQYTTIIKILNNDIPVGFMVLNRAKEKGYVVLDYLAILPQYRNKGFGTKALQILLEQERENDGVFIEIEKVGCGNTIEDNIRRVKRKDFYERLGFKKLNYDLLLFGVVFTPYLYSDKNDDESTIINQILNIYESVSGKEKIKQNCKFTNKLRFEQITEIDEGNLNIMTNWMYNWWGKKDGLTLEKVKCYMKHSMQKDRFPQTYGLFLDDKIIGMYQFTLEDLDVRPDIYPWLANVYIDEEYRNKGYARKLLENVKENTKQSINFDELFLYTRHVGLYEKFGFEYISDIDTYNEESRIEKLYRLNLK